MKRGQWLPIIEAVTVPAEQLPFDLLPYKSLPSSSTARRVVRQPSAGKGDEKAELRVVTGRTSGHNHIISGKYVDVSSEDYLVVFSNYGTPVSSGGKSYVEEHQQAVFIPWEEIIFMELDAECMNPD